MLVRHATGSYPIHIGSGLLDRAGKLLAEVLDPDSRHVVVMDGNLEKYDYFPRLMTSLQIACSQSNATINPDHFLKHSVAPGESTKSLDSVAAACQTFIDEGVDRRSTVIALGGGVAGDLAGYVAASFLRGVSFVQIPTTLLAQVDSSVGGKTGVNLPNAKNSVGAFWQPQSVIIDPEVLRTLDPAEYTSGLAEVVKYGVIMDDEFFSFLEANSGMINSLDMPTLEKVIKRCCELKAKVVEQDERETSGLRAILNYGHTFGHAIESVFGYGTYPHGHAVAIGMHAAAHLAHLLRRVDDMFVQRQKNLLTALNIPCSFPTEQHSNLAAAMQHDKKTVGGDIRFILPSKIGEVELVGSIDTALVLQAMHLAGQ